MMTINKDEDFYFLSLLLLIFFISCLFVYIYIFYWNDIFFIETIASSVSAFFLITKVITMRKRFNVVLVGGVIKHILMLSAELME